MSKEVLEIIKEYKKTLSLYDRNAEFVKGQLFALKVIKKEIKLRKKEAKKK